MKRILTLLAIAAATAVTAALTAPSTASSASAGPQSLPPLPPASAFGTGTVNPWFPIVPGTTSTFTGAIDGVAARELFTVTGEVKVVDGVPANVIHDRLYLARESGAGRYLAEDTMDWYATADNGDVWYLGEATTEYDEQGHVVSTDGSWQAGVGGARAGIFMPATPTVGATYQQESAVDAKDLFRITSVDGDTLTTREWTPLEPGLVTKKVYASGTGQVLEDTVKGQAIEDLWLHLVGRS
jgi:hypothetical protein